MCSDFMKEAILQAKKTISDIPVGAVIVKNDKIIASAHNEKEESNDILSHAEIVAMRIACEKLGNWRLDECDIYVTLEPCPMCGWAILQSRIKRIYFGSYDLKYGAFSKINLEKYSGFKPKIYGGLCEHDCDRLLFDFFQKIR